MTIHKKQGDEDDNIVVIKTKEDCHYSASQASNNEIVFNLIYTAISRAKKRCILLGDKATYENM